MKKFMGQILENEIPVGNWYDKYNTKNPVARYLLRDFLKSIETLLNPVKKDIASITEVGCGEGYLTNYLCSLNITANIKGCDFSARVIEIAKRNVQNPAIKFYVKDIYQIDDDDAANLIVCCEVLEHLKRPEEALDKIRQITKRYCLLSVPNEPVWRIMNLCRGKYIKDGGNTPGHLNHWSSRSFVKLVSDYFGIVDFSRPLPWTVILAKV